MEDIQELKRQGLSLQAISELTRFDRKTVRKYLIEPCAISAYQVRPTKAGKLDGHKEYLEQRLQAGVWNARVLVRELRERGYSGGYTILTDWLRPQRSAARMVCGASRRHLASILVDGCEHQLWGFAFTLGHRRAMVAEAAMDQKMGTLLRLHEEAFRQLGGVPEEILYDRMKTVWTGMTRAARLYGTRRFWILHVTGASNRGSAGQTARRRKARWRPA